MPLHTALEFDDTAEKLLCSLAPEVPGKRVGRAIKSRIAGTRADAVKMEKTGFRGITVKRSQVSAK